VGGHNDAYIAMLRRCSGEIIKKKKESEAETIVVTMRLGKETSEGSCARKRPTGRKKANRTGSGTISMLPSLHPTIRIPEATQKSSRRGRKTDVIGTSASSLKTICPRPPSQTPENLQKIRWGGAESKSRKRQGKGEEGMQKGAPVAWKEKKRIQKFHPSTTGMHQSPKGYDGTCIIPKMGEAIDNPPSMKGKSFGRNTKRNETRNVQVAISGLAPRAAPACTKRGIGIGKKTTRFASGLVRGIKVQLVPLDQK